MFTQKKIGRGLEVVGALALLSSPLWKGRVLMFALGGVALVVIGEVLVRASSNVYGPEAP